MRDPGLRDDYRTEVQVGALMIVAALVLLFGVFWLTGGGASGGRVSFHGVTSDAGQVTDGARVFLMGVDVGEVRDVKLDGLRVVLEMRITADARLPSDTRGFIRPAGFLGSQMVQLVPGTSDRLLSPGDTIPLGSIADIQTLAADLGEDAGSVLGRLRDLLAEETVDGIRESAAGTASLMRELDALVRNERAAIEELAEGLSRTASNLAEVSGSEDLGRTIARLDSLTERLTHAAAGLDSSSHSLASITARLDAGEGTIGRLLTDEGLYEDISATVEALQTASEEIAMLTRDIREQPERYLKGLRFSVF